MVAVRARRPVRRCAHRITGGIRVEPIGFGSTIVRCAPEPCRPARRSPSGAAARCPSCRPSGSASARGRPACRRRASARCVPASVLEHGDRDPSCAQPEGDRSRCCGRSRRRARTALETACRWIGLFSSFSVSVIAKAAAVADEQARARVAVERSRGQSPAILRGEPVGAATASARCDRLPRSRSQARSRTRAPRTPSRQAATRIQLASGTFDELRPAQHQDVAERDAQRACPGPCT